MVVVVVEEELMVSYRHFLSSSNPFSSCFSSPFSLISLTSSPLPFNTYNFHPFHLTYSYITLTLPSHSYSLPFPIKTHPYSSLPPPPALLSSLPLPLHPSPSCGITLTHPIRIPITTHPFLLNPFLFSVLLHPSPHPPPSPFPRAISNTGS